MFEYVHDMLVHNVSLRALHLPCQFRKINNSVTSLKYNATNSGDFKTIDWNVQNELFP